MSFALKSFTCAAIFALTLPAFALETPSSASGDSRVRFISYQPYNITKIVGSLRSSVEVEFAADEEIAHVALGNSVAWEVAPAGNILFLKPREDQPVTNLSVVTTKRDGSKRSYQFELTIRSGDVTPASGTYFLLKFRYPQDEAEQRRLAAAQKASEREAGKVDEVLELHEQYGPRNWHYSAQGAYAIEPTSVYDNGKVTTFTFGGNAEIPAIYIQNSDGTASLVPKSVDGNMVMVHAISRKFTLRRGRDTLCVFNEAFSPEGINPETNTTSPSVERVVKAQAKVSAR
ncbi:P-type conjugative transfer protein VirB9 [Brucella pseudogrignonensis]|uniref:P-type conjugative transfer protein VirB9 n=1 Tax=Brucella pseudogrignonensis TaxID=419475 RepID=UPI0038D083E9